MFRTHTLFFSPLLCQNFVRKRRLELKSSQQVPCSHHHDFTNNVAGSHVFSTLDLAKGYYQVKMFPDDIP